MLNTDSAYNRATAATEFRELKRQLAEANKPQIKVRVLRACGVDGKVFAAGHVLSLPRLTALGLIECRKAERVEGK